VSREPRRRAATAARTAEAAEAVSWLLDTDVICQPAKKTGDPKVIAWLEAEQDRCYTSAVVIAQLAYWVRTKEGRQRQALQAWLTRLVDALQGRIHGFNVSVAHVWAEQERLLQKTGQRMPVEDSYIAATARRHGLTIATGNDRDYKRPGLKVFNPFKELP
jgi:predicted nucleic acid-binding protein